CPRASLPVVARVLRILSSERWGLRSAQVRFRGPSDWTESEREVASLSLQGFDLCEIAAHRRASTSTVRTQLRIAARKAHCVDRYEIGVSELVRLDVVGR